MVATKKNIKQKLALATCSLLSQQAIGEAVENDWVVDLSFLSYNESDDRVSVKKTIANVSGKFTERDKADVTVVFDTMTGSTPTGRIAGGNSVAVTAVSGQVGGAIGSSNSALAPFDDTRLAVKADWERELSSRLRIRNGAAISVETDYTSLGYSFNFDLDSLSKLTTYNLGIAFTYDTISQLGGVIPVPISELSRAMFIEEEGNRNSLDMIFGISSVINANTVWQNNISFSFSDGYHTDPYKVISVVGMQCQGDLLLDPFLCPDGIAGDFRDVELVTLFESRPDSRQRTVYNSTYIHHLDNNQTMNISYRYYADDWKITSHTIDYRHRFNYSGGQYLESHLRFYTQEAAEFFRHSLSLDEYRFCQTGAEIPLCQYMSADYRLDNMTGTTLGAKFGKAVGDNGEVRMRLEFIHWEAENAEIKETDAFILQLSYQVGFF